MTSSIGIHRGRRMIARLFEHRRPSDRAATTVSESSVGNDGRFFLTSVIACIASVAHPLVRLSGHLSHRGTVCQGAGVTFFEFLYIFLFSSSTWCSRRVAVSSPAGPRADRPSTPEDPV